MQIRTCYSRISSWGISVLLYQTEEEILTDWIMCKAGTMVLWILKYHCEDWVNSLSTCTTSKNEIP